MRKGLAVGTLMVISAILAVLVLVVSGEALYAEGKQLVAQGGGRLVFEVSPPPGGDALTHVHSFGFTVLKSGPPPFHVNLEYNDSHDNVPSGPDGGFSLHVNGAAFNVRYNPVGGFLYFQANALRRFTGQPATPEIVCVWVKDGSPDLFHLETATGYSSQPPLKLGCPQPPPPDPVAPIPTTAIVQDGEVTIR